jgi:hypothetical protein
MTTTTPDDLEAVRQISSALQPFKEPERERILRWVREKMGLPADVKGTVVVSDTGVASTTPATRTGLPPSGLPAGVGKDIKTFVTEKNPPSDKQFAAVVAYYYAFEAPEDSRKGSITGADLQDACRKAGRQRLTKPAQTLINACFAGLLDKAAEKGAYSINSVGENLVAMTLPGQSGVAPKRIVKPKTKKKSSKAPKASTKK